MKKKLLLLTFMVLMGAMASSAGQVYVNNNPSISHGNVSVNFDTDYPAPGGTITLFMVPDNGYFLYKSDIVIEEYDDQDSFVGNISPSGPSEAYGPENYTFVMPADATHNVHVTATFTGLEYPVNGVGQTTQGSFCVSHINGIPIDLDTWNRQARTGDIVIETSYPNLGWELDNFSVFASGLGDFVPVRPVTPVDPFAREFTMPASPVDIQATFKKSDFTITIEQGSNGTIDVFRINGIDVPPGAPQPYIAQVDDVIELVITPNNGYEIYWIDLVADESDYDKMLNDGEADFVMPPCNITLRPHFTPARFTLTFDINGSGSVRAMPSNNLHAGQRVRLAVTPGRGYMLPVSNLEVEQFDGGFAIALGLEPFSDIMWDDPSVGTPQTAFTLPFAPPYNVRVRADFQPLEYPVDCNSPTHGGTFEVSDIAGNPPASLGYDPRHVQALVGQTITLVYACNPGYTFIQYIATYQENGVDIPITVSSTGQFTMPPGPVTIQAVFKHAYTLDLTQNVLGGTLYVQTINSSPPPPLPCTVYEGDVVVVNCTPPPGYDVDHFRLEDNAATCFSAMPGNPVTFVIPDYTDTYTNELFISVVYKPRQHKVRVQRNRHGTAEAWWGSIPAYDAAARVYNSIDYNGLVQLNVTFCGIGYEFDHYELYDQANINGPQLTVPLLPAATNPNASFSMPDCDVLVVPVFKPKDYVLTVDMWNYPGGEVTATNTSATPPTSATAGWMGTTYNPTSTITNVHMGDLIQLSLNPDLTWSANSLQYYEFKRTGDGYYIGGLVPSSYFPPATAYFTMPPCDLTISAVIIDSWGQWDYPPIDVQFLGARVNGGIVYLEELTWLAKHSKSSPDEEEQNLENYGWAHAVPGEPMHFVVIPDPGYQVRKSDITVRLIEPSQGEGDDEGKVLKTFKSADGIEIFGPDEFVTELTEYYFIFDVPEGVDPHTVKVEIDANFIPIDFAITVDGAIEHGTITAPATANVDETVTLTVTPEPGYSLANIMVLPESPGYIVEVDSNNQFTMPACSVMVTAVFEEGGHDFALGDVNHDGLVGIEDVTTVIDYILSGNVDLCATCADVNGDGIIGIADVIGIIDMILGL